MPLLLAACGLKKASGFVGGAIFPQVTREILDDHHVMSCSSASTR